MRSDPVLAKYHAAVDQEDASSMKNFKQVNIASGLTALFTFGLVSPLVALGVVPDLARRLIGTNGFRADAEHFDADARKAIDRATKEASDRFNASSDL